MVELRPETVVGERLRVEKGDDGSSVRPAAWMTKVPSPAYNRHSSRSGWMASSGCCAQTGTAVVVSLVCLRSYSYIKENYELLLILGSMAKGRRKGVGNNANSGRSGSSDQLIAGRAYPCDQLVKQFLRLRPPGQQRKPRHGATTGTSRNSNLTWYYMYL